MPLLSDDAKRNINQVKIIILQGNRYFLVQLLAFALGFCLFSLFYRTTDFPIFIVNFVIRFFLGVVAIWIYSKYVFKNGPVTLTISAQYFLLLFASNFLASGILVIYAGFINAYAAKIAADLSVFLFNYAISKIFIFRHRDNR